MTIDNDAVYLRINYNRIVTVKNVIIIE